MPNTTVRVRTIRLVERLPSRSNTTDRTVLDRLLEQQCRAMRTAGIEPGPIQDFQSSDEPRCKCSS
jgi:hypothetical protein